ncbi:hypothetical protein [Photobacterium damselae]|uniref:hypothetical protein n=1 Tax=Photobacterium damselae TaxID=38293 RepID=UPI0010FF475A|nr:hypothetical protein [Photobacterium damselae]TLS73442.1 hypothetical protein FD718_02015 [Photobacterium damselae subsp. damselae]
MDKLTKTILENGLPLIREELVELENTLNVFPEKLAEKIDPIIQENTNKIVDAAELTKKHVDELQEKNKEIIQKDFNKAHTDFIIATKDSLDRLFEPHAEKLANIPDSIDDLSSKIDSISQPKNNNFLIIIIMFLSIMAGSILSFIATDHYNAKQLAQSQQQYDILASSVGDLMDDLPKKQKDKMMKSLNEKMVKHTRRYIQSK